MATARTAQSTLERFRRIRPARLPQRRSPSDERRVVVADIDGGGGRGGLLGSSSADMLAPAGPVAVAPSGFTGAPVGGLMGVQPAMSQGALQGGLQLAQQVGNVAKTVGGLLGGGGGLGAVGAGPSGFGGASAATGGFSMAPSVAGSGAGAVPLAGAGAAPVVEPVGGLSGVAPAVAAGGLAAAAPLLAFGGPAAAAAVYSQFNDASRARGSFKVAPGGEITHRNIKDASIASRGAFNAFADWVGEQIRESGAKVPEPGEVSFGVRGRDVFLQPAGGGDRQFFSDPRDLLSALTAMGGRRQDFSGLDVPDFSEAGRQAAAAEAERLTGLVGGPTGAPGGPVAGTIFEPTGMIGRLERMADVQGLIDQPEFRQAPVRGPGLLR